MTTVVKKPETRREMNGIVHCPLCTHRVPATVLVDRRSAIVKPGQKCARCNSSLDAGYVLQLQRAA
ncbi:MAG: hypothetical protein JNN08_10240 [Bryobacterales bacterium]|jgi:hypothetical protein|nr:hypothetical protein [Bryobacterales bacterium]